MVDPLSLQLAQAGHGLYFHVAVEGGKQTTETIPPRRIFDTIGKFVKKKVVPTLPFPCSHFARFHRLDETEPRWVEPSAVAGVAVYTVGLTLGVRNLRKATRIVILNLSDIKPVPIGTAAVMVRNFD